MQPKFVIVGDPETVHKGRSRNLVLAQRRRH
jgi:hypothetical protein